MRFSECLNKLQFQIREVQYHQKLQDKRGVSAMLYKLLFQGLSYKLTKLNISRSDNQHFYESCMKPWYKQFRLHICEDLLPFSVFCKFHIFGLKWVFGPKNRTALKNARDCISGGYVVFMYQWNDEIKSRKFGGCKVVHEKGFYCSALLWWQKLLIFCKDELKCEV